MTVALTIARPDHYPHVRPSLYYAWLRPINGTVWPISLKRLSFRGPCFNQPIHMAALPRGLEVLKLGAGFDQPLKAMAWPEGLIEVELGDMFDQDMEGVVWPKSVQRISAPSADLGDVPIGCVVTVRPNVQHQIDEDVASIFFMMLDASYGFGAFMGMQHGMTDEDEDDYNYNNHYENDPDEYDEDDYGPDLLLP